MAAPKGHERYGGKQKGSKNKKTMEWEAIGDYLIGDGAKRAAEIMRTCKDEQFMSYFGQMIEYFRPKLARTEMTGKDGERLIDNKLPSIVIGVSEDVINKLKQK